MALSWSVVALACLPGLAIATAGASSSPDSAQYMKQYANKYAGTGGDASGMDYQHFMHQYAGKYMGGANGAGSSQDYQHFMDQYAGKYMGGANSSQDYQHFMDQYAGKYMGGANGAGSGMDYQHFMDQYADKYMGGAKGAGSGMDYQHFMDQYADKYMNMYAANSSHLQSFAEAMEHNPVDCKTMQCICDFHKNHVGLLTASIPAKYSSYARNAAEMQYQGMLRDYAQHHNTTVSKLQLPSGCHGPAATVALAATPRPGPSDYIVPAGLALMALASFSLGTWMHYRQHDDEKESAYYLVMP